MKSHVMMKGRSGEHFVIGLMILLLTLILVACGGSSKPSHGPAGSSIAKPVVKKVSVRLRHGSFQPASISVLEGQTVRLTLLSLDTSHILNIDELGVSIPVAPAQTVVREFTVMKVGTYLFYCTVPGHRRAGMQEEILNIGKSGNCE